MVKNITEVNIKYYDNLYKKKNILFQAIYPWISFDQQSKSKNNYQCLKPFLQSSKKSKIPIKYLDYGFGHGSLLLKAPQKENLYGCDISAEAVHNFPQIAKLFGKKVTTFTPEEFDKISQTVSFDVISISHVLEHVDNDFILLNKLVGSLNKGGIILINLPINEVWEDPKHIRKYDKKTIIDLVKKCNCVIELVKETARINGFLLHNEMVKKPNIFKKFLLRVLRFILAVTPIQVTYWVDHLLKNNYQNTHIIVLAKKL